MHSDSQLHESTAVKYRCEQLAKKHLEPLLSELSSIAKANGGNGIHYKNALGACMMVQESLAAMSKGER